MQRTLGSLGLCIYLHKCLITGLTFLTFLCSSFAQIVFMVERGCLTQGGVKGGLVKLVENLLDTKLNQYLSSPHLCAMVCRSSLQLEYVKCELDSIAKHIPFCVNNDIREGTAVFFGDCFAMDYFPLKGTKKRQPVRYFVLMALGIESFCLQPCFNLTWICTATDENGNIILIFEV